MHAQQVSKCISNPMGEPDHRICHQLTVAFSAANVNPGSQKFNSQQSKRASTDLEHLLFDKQDDLMMLHRWIT